MNYDNLISHTNSITNVDDLVSFIYKFIENPPKNYIGGTYNVTNKGSIEAKEVVEIMKKYGLENPNWKFVSIPEAKFKVERSNCVLSTTKIEDVGLGLPDIKDSIEKAVKEYSIRKDELTHEPSQ